MITSGHRDTTPRDRTRSGKAIVAGVGYLNARPIVDALDRAPYTDNFELERVVPAEAAHRVSEREALLGLLPVAAAATYGDIEFVRGIAIGAKGPVRSVLVVSRRPLDEIDTVLLDGSSRTSVVLARLVLARLRKNEPRYIGFSHDRPLDEVVDDRTAAVVIGDPALEIEHAYPHVLDLARAWLDWTALPFVFAAWGGLPGAVTAQEEELLRRALAEGLEARRAIADAYAASGQIFGASTSMPTYGGSPEPAASHAYGLRNPKAAPRTRIDAETAYAYLTESIRYDFGDDERRGLTRFYDEAARAGLLPKAEVRFADEQRRPPRAEPSSAASNDHLPAPNGHLSAKADHVPAKVGPSEPSLDALLDRAAEGTRLSGAEALRIAREATLFDIGTAADTVRRRKHPQGVVTYIVDRNVNYTNVCTTSCRFCAFYRPVGHSEGYVLSRDELSQKLKEVVDAGGVQILLQGGLNPDLAIEWYEDLFRWMKAEFKLGLHALSPEEIWFIARRENLTLQKVLERLHRAGLDSVPGGGAEILVDRVRRRIAKAKCTSEMWLEVMRVAHRMGLRSSATMMYGTTDDLRDRVVHLLKLRDLQDETGGFTAFFCWDFQHEQGTRIEAGETGTNYYLRMQALARLVLDNFDHIGASWVTQGPDIGELALRFGADDFGSVMFEENVVSSAGTTYCIDAGAIEGRIHAAGFRSVRRNVRYDWLTSPA